MMKNKNKKRLFSMFAALLLVQAAAQATYVATSLPESSLWQGHRTYNQNDIVADVEYAVYDTQAAGYHTAFDGLIDGFENRGTGRYIYVYQIFNDAGASSTFPPITAFELIGGNPAQADGIVFMNNENGIAPTVLPTSDDPAFVWKFADGVFVATKYSAILVFSSDHAPVVGSFKISTNTDNGDEPPIPDQTAPEPATLAMLAAGALGLLKRRGKNN